MKVFHIGVDDTTLAFLRQRGFGFDTEEDIETPDDLHDWIVDGDFDAILMNLDATDWGILAIRYLRSRNIQTTVVGLAKPDPDLSWSEQRSTFLENGGDDLLRNPPNPRELAASLRTATRRGKGLTLDIREFTMGEATVKINLSTNSVSVNGRPVHLTGKEMLLFSLLASTKGRTKSKESILSGIYTSLEDEPEIKIIDVFVCKLRKKLTDIHPDAGQVIETVWGRGYQINQAAREHIAIAS